MSRLQGWWASMRGTVVPLELTEDQRGMGERVVALLEELGTLDADSSYEELTGAIMSASNMLAELPPESTALYAALATAWATSLFNLYSRTGDDTYFHQAAATFELVTGIAGLHTRQRFLVRSNGGRNQFGRALRTGELSASRAAEREYAAALGLAPRLTRERQTLKRYRTDAQRLSSRIEIADRATGSRSDGELRGSRVAAAITSRYSSWIRIRQQVWWHSGRHATALKKLTARSSWSSRSAYAEALSELGETFRRAYDTSGRLIDLQEGTLVAEWAHSCFPQSRLYQTRLSVLVRMLGLHLSQPAHIVRAVELARAAFEGTPEDDREWVTYAWNLAIALKRLYLNVSDDLLHLDEAISLEERIVALERDQTPAGAARNLATSYLHRGHGHDDARDLRRAIELLRADLDLAHISAADVSSVATLVQAQHLLAQREGSIERTQETVELAGQMALALGHPHPQFLGLAAIAADASADLFEATGDRRALDASIELSRLAFAQHGALDARCQAGLILMRALTQKISLMGPPTADGRERLMLHETVERLAELDPERFGDLAERVPAELSLMALYEDEWAAAGTRLLELRTQLATERDDREAWRLRWELCRIHPLIHTWPNDLPPLTQLVEDLLDRAEGEAERLAAVCEWVQVRDDLTLHEIDGFVNELSLGLRRGHTTFELADSLPTALVPLLVQRFERGRVRSDLDVAAEVARTRLRDVRDGARRFPTEAKARLALARVGLRMASADWSQPQFDEVIDDLQALLEQLGRSLESHSVDDHHLVSSVRSTLADTLQIRYQLAGDLADLDAAIEVRLNQRNPGGVELAQALVMRFEARAHADDLDLAIAVLEGELDDEDLGAAEDRVFVLCEKCIALRLRWVLRGDADDLWTAVGAAHRAWEALESLGEPGHRMRSYVSSIVATAHGDAHQATNNSAHLAEAIHFAREAVAAPAFAPWEDAMRLVNLAAHLQMRARLLIGQARVDTATEAVEVLELAEQRALNLPLLKTVRSALADALVGRHRLTGSARDAQRAEQLLREVAEPGASGVGLLALRRLGSLYAERGDLEHAFESYRTLLYSLRDAAPRWLGRGDRENSLAQYLGVAEHAVELALDLGETESAVEVFELASTVLVHNELLFAAELDRLSKVAPGLHQALLERWKVSEARAEGTEPDLTMARALPGRIAASDSATEVIANVRRLPGFEDFLRVPPLSRHTNGQRVLILNLGPQHVDAIQVFGESLTHIRLTGLDSEEARRRCEDLVEQMNLALDLSGGSDVARHERAVSATLAWLWDEVAGPLFAELGLAEAPEPPRVHWCGNGLLRLVPWHAVGRPRQRVGVIFSVVSSYASSLTSLSAVPQSDLPSPGAPDSLVLIAMPTSPGPLNLSPLPGALEEGQWLLERYATALAIGLPLSTPATSEHVLAALQERTWAHFACHAVADPQQPHRSLIALRDVATAPLTAVRLSQARTPSLAVAFLAACSTSFASGIHPNETLNIAHALEQAGCHHVVGTMWPIYDEVSIEVVKGFYSRIPETGLSDDAVARALHETLIELCTAMPDSPTMWAAHVHAGP